MRRTLWVMGVLVVLGGCATIDDYRNPKVDFDAAPPVAMQPVVQRPSTGAIYAASAYRPLFEDHRARLPGDTIIITIVEKISASQKSTSSVERTGSIKAGVTALPGLLAGANALQRSNIGTNSANTHDGKGATEASNEFQGTITATVTDVLPNGHLIISGEKQIGLNANVDVLRFSGQIDPRTILPGNSVPSTAVANVRLQQRSRGQSGDAQVMGVVGRFFMSMLPI